MTINPHVLTAAPGFPPAWMEQFLLQDHGLTGLEEREWKRYKLKITNVQLIEGVEHVALVRDGLIAEGKTAEHYMTPFSHAVDKDRYWSRNSFVPQAMGSRFPGYPDGGVAIVANYDTRADLSVTGEGLPAPYIQTQVSDRSISQPLAFRDSSLILGPVRLENRLYFAAFRFPPTNVTFESPNQPWQEGRSGRIFSTTPDLFNGGLSPEAQPETERTPDPYLPWDIDNSDTGAPSGAEMFLATGTHWAIIMNNGTPIDSGNKPVQAWVWNRSGGGSHYGTVINPGNASTPNPQQPGHWDAEGGVGLRGDVEYDITDDDVVLGDPLSYGGAEGTWKRLPPTPESVEARWFNTTNGEVREISTGTLVRQYGFPFAEAGFQQLLVPLDGL